ncbi:MAG: carboxypeptidase-like regulatory domain-containing protein, partial [Chitinophagaceae bacterium]
MVKRIIFYSSVILAVFTGEGKAQSVKTIKADTIKFRVSGVCEMCKDRIEEAAKGKGVEKAEWDVDSKMLTLYYYPALTNPERVQQRIANAGHDTPLKIAKDNVYLQLPDCCRYREPGIGNHNDGGDNNSVEIAGMVMEVDEKGNFKPLQGASIIINGTTSGVSTNANGYFTLSLEKESETIAISYAGFQSKNIEVKQGQHLSIVMDQKKELQEVKITSRKRSSYISPTSTIRTLVMTEKELFKAACCNLSESFETNSTVDVSYNDGVTGSKQIQLLGLSGIYSQLNIENLPGPRGIATLWGLNSIPGTWVESIQLSKGVGSVANGFESITGQINVELKKPETAEKLFANAYVN